MIARISVHIALALSCSALAWADDPYAPEINSVREREREYVKALSPRLIGIVRLQSAASRTQAILSRISGPLSEQTLPGEITYGQLLGKISRDIALTEIALSETRIARPELESLSEEMASAAREAGLDPTNREVALAIGQPRETLSRLARVGEQLEQRRRKARAQLERWIESEQAVLARQQISDDERSRSRLEFFNEMYRVNNLLNRAVSAIERKLSAGDRVGARELFDGMVWLRSSLHSMYAAQATDPEKRKRLELLIEAHLPRERALTRRFAALLPRRLAVNSRDHSANLLSEPMMLLASFTDESEGYSTLVETSESLAQPGSDSDGINIPVWDVAPNRSYTDLGKRSVMIDGQRFEAEKVPGGETKRVIDVQNSIDHHARTVLVDGARVVSQRPITEASRVRQQTEAELVRKMRDYYLRTHDALVIRPMPPLEIIEPPTGVDTIPRQTSDVQKMIRDASKDKAPDPKLAELSSELARYQKIQAWYERELHSSLTDLFSAVNANRATLDVLNTRNLDEFRLVVPLTPEEVVELNAAKLRALTGIFDAVLMTPVLGDVPQIGDSAVALLTGNDLLGRPVSITESSLLGIAAIASLSTTGGVMPPQAGAKLLKNAAKLLKGDKTLFAAQLKYAGRIGKYGDEFAGSLGTLSGSLLEAFRGAPKQTVMEPGTVVFRIVGQGRKGMGSWYSFARPTTAAKAEFYFNIAKWQNVGEEIKAFVVRERTSCWIGHVEGGVGDQIFIPHDLLDDGDLLHILEEIKF